MPQALLLPLDQLEYALEGFRFSGMVQVDGEGAFPCGDALFLKDMDRLPGHGGGGIDDLDPGTGQPLYHRLEEGVMGTAS